MARPNKEATRRKATEQALLKALSENKTYAQYYLDQVSEYMGFYDNLVVINAELKKIKRLNDDNNSKFIELTKEKRQITKEMRAIITFLGLSGENLEDNSDDL